MSVDFLEILVPFIPSDYEMKLLVNYEKDGRPLEELTDEDQFILRFGKIPRLTQRINTFTFMGNFPDTVKRLQPVSLSNALQLGLKLTELLNRCTDFVFTSSTATELHHCCVHVHKVFNQTEKDLRGK